MEAYNRFNFVIYKWLRFFGLGQGQDILRPEWKQWSIFTTISFVTAISIPFMYMWTIFYFSGDLAMKAFGYLGIGYQVRAFFFFKSYVQPSNGESFSSDRLPLRLHIHLSLEKV